MIEVDIIRPSSIEVDINALNVIDISDEITFSAETDHRKLTHRDAEKQHPIEAIDGLEKALDELEDFAIGTIEIDDIFKKS